MHFTWNGLSYVSLNGYNSLFAATQFIQTKAKNLVIEPLKSDKKNPFHWPTLCNTSRCFYSLTHWPLGICNTLNTIVGTHSNIYAPLKPISQCQPCPPTHTHRLYTKTQCTCYNMTSIYQLFITNIYLLEQNCVKGLFSLYRKNLKKYDPC